MTLRSDLREVWTLGGQRPRHVLRRVLQESMEDRVTGYAAQLAYYFLFSLFPFFIFLAALLPYTPVPNMLDEIMKLIRDVVPGEAADVIQDNVRDLLLRPRASLLSFGFLSSLWFASSAVGAIGAALNQAYGVKEGRPLWKVRATAMVLTLALGVLMIVSMTLLIFGPYLGFFLADRLGVGPEFGLFWQLVRWPLIVFLLILAAALIYYFAPDVEQEWRWITPGSALSVLAWLGASLLFRYYVENFGAYNKTYGSIGAIIVLLTWMYLGGLFLLIGGEVNAEIEHAAKTGKNKGEKKLPPRAVRESRSHARASQH